MSFKSAASLLGLFFAITPLSHAEPVEDELVKELSKQAIQEACVKAAEGNLSLQEAILKTEKENVRWLAAVESMSAQLRTELALRLANRSGFNHFKTYLDLKTKSPDHNSEQIENVYHSVRSYFSTPRSDHLRYEKQQWRKELERRFELAYGQASTLSLARRQFQYVDAIFRITAAAFVTLPKATRETWDNTAKMELEPFRNTNVITRGGLYGGAIGLSVGFALDVALLNYVGLGPFSSAGTIVGVIAGRLLGKVRSYRILLHELTTPIISSSPISTLGPTLVQPSKGLSLSEVYGDRSFPEQVASSYISLLDGVQLGAWELSVLQDEATQAFQESKKSVWNLALRVELLYFELGQIVRIIKEYEDRFPQSPELQTIAKALELRGNQAKRLSSMLIFKEEEFLASEEGNGSIDGLVASAQPDQSVHHRKTKLQWALENAAQQEMDLRKAQLGLK